MKKEKSAAPAPAVRSKKKPRGRPWKKGQSGNPATQFVPGVSGNPGGNPRFALVSQACRAKLGETVPDDPCGRTYAQYYADQLAFNMLCGSMSAGQELTDRAEGRTRQTLDVNDGRGDPLGDLIEEFRAEYERTKTEETIQ